MKYSGLCAGTYTDKSLAPASDRCQNLYPHSLSGAASPEAQKVLVHTPGYAPDFSFPALAPIEMIYREPATETLMIISGQQVWIGNTGRGPIGPGPYKMCSNGVQVMISCAGDFSGYIINTSTLAVSKITAPGFLGTVDCAMLDNYFISLVPNSRKFQISSLLDGTQWNAADSALVQGGPENARGLLVSHDELWIFSGDHAEVFQDTGNANFPFERIRSIIITHGLAAPYALCALDNTVYWIGRNEQGYGRVFRADGYVPKAVSTPGVEFFFNMYINESLNVTNLQKITMYGYQNETGHTFLVINFPTATSDIGLDGTAVPNVINGAQWVYDVGENEWHERMTIIAGKQTAARGIYHTFINGKHYVGGGAGSNLLYTMSESFYTDTGATILRVRRAPHIVNSMKWVNYHYLRLSAKVGFSPTAGAADDKIFLRTSNDGGMTWSAYYAKSLGHTGEYTKEICWRRLGRAKRRVFEFSTSVLTGICLMEADLGVDGEQ